MTCHQMKMLRTQLQILTWRSAYTSFFTVWKNHTNLSDGTSYDLIYACYGVKNGELKSEAGGFKYFTSADIGSYWNNLNTELEAIPINESELP